MSWLQDALLHLSEALLVPVIGILLLLVVTSFLGLGAFLREAKDRRSGTRCRVAAFVGVAGNNGDDVSRLRTEMERVQAVLSRRIDRDVIISRVAPMLGLAGTLIPLGPALHQLGTSDFTVFADKIVVAFTTTVAGLVVCAIRYIVSSVRARWYEDDLRRIEAIVGVEHVA
ncbi:MAG: MotA/TolQ/ExbB proton channel family protein [Planctomycetes bacterium]|nr:MotA/TolQ/ExbB proton channel family protein [Planctomycetota bacterium]MCB9919523.1 MotA/TolQ/ExbB proton channel family protein [Planctomycetota bacterium]